MKAKEANREENALSQYNEKLTVGKDWLKRYNPGGG